MAIQYGVNFLTSDIKDALSKNQDVQNGVKTWQNFFNTANLDYKTRTSDLTADYSSAISQAYMANLENQNLVTSAGFNKGFTDKMMSASGSDLQTAYNTYLSEYSKSLNTAMSDYGTTVSNIDTALTQRAENLSSLYNKTYDYLKDELSKSNYSELNYDKILGLDEEGNNIYGENVKDYLSEKGLSWVFGNEGVLKSWNDLSKILFDENGAITEQGKQYFDAMFNANTENYYIEDDKGVRTASRGFDEWLGAKDVDLRDWMQSQDLYSSAGTNLGMAKEMLGLSATDFDDNVKDRLRTTIKSGGLDALKSSLKDIQTISLMKQDYTAKEGINQTKTYSEWFKEIEKHVEELKGSPWKGVKEDTFRSESVRYSQAMGSFIEEYQKSVDDRYNILKTELTKVLGDDVFTDFWTKHGNDIDRIYGTIQTDRNTGFKMFENSRDRYKRLYGEAVKLRDSGFDKATNELYKKLEEYLKNDTSELYEKLEEYLKN